ncbi:hypothetical protein HaLaN_29070 [Haematococcus lacustris]|uniref:Uncharacterized protein n=1 Tax=Haematococcus lacustris TaxID=44745 RepID=A0A6A0AD46_HAELA|nr:hypothetical protein HaLaN_29070 [Haematococcus lacustris]
MHEHNLLLCPVSDMCQGMQPWLQDLPRHNACLLEGQQLNVEDERGNCGCGCRPGAGVRVVQVRSCCQFQASEHT